MRSVFFNIDEARVWLDLITQKQGRKKLRQSHKVMQTVQKAYSCKTASINYSNLQRCWKFSLMPLSCTNVVFSYEMHTGNRTKIKKEDPTVIVVVRTGYIPPPPLLANIYRQVQSSHKEKDRLRDGKGDSYSNDSKEAVVFFTCFGSMNQDVCRCREIFYVSNI